MDKVKEIFFKVIADEKVKTAFKVLVGAVAAVIAGQIGWL